MNMQPNNMIDFDAHSFITLKFVNYVENSVIECTGDRYQEFNIFMKLYFDKRGSTKFTFSLNGRMISQNEYPALMNLGITKEITVTPCEAPYEIVTLTSSSED